MVRPCEDVLSGETVDKKTVRTLSLRPNGKRGFWDEEWAREHGFSEMISIPVLNSCNTNHVELVVNLFPEDGSTGDFDPRTVTACAEYVALAYESLIGDMCQAAAAEVEAKVAEARSLDDFLEVAVHSLQILLDCKGLTLFLPDPAQKRLSVGRSTGIEWRTPPDQEFYEKGDGQSTTRVWTEKQPMLVYRRPKGFPPKSFEGAGNVEQDACLIVPLLDGKGEVAAIVRCLGKRKKGRMFSESDISIVDAVSQAIVPNLAVLRADERRKATLARLVHELGSPIVAIQGATGLVDAETQRKGLKFAYPYTRDILEWCVLMRQLLSRARFFRQQGLERLPVRPRRILLLKEALASRTVADRPNATRPPLQGHGDH